MSKYSFYAKPKDDSNYNIIVSSNTSIHTLMFILLNNGLYKYYTLINEPLEEDCFVEEHHAYKILRLGWSDLCKEVWYDEDTIPFSVVINPNKLVSGLRDFYNKPFVKRDFINKLNNDIGFKYIIEEILGKDIDYIDMYFNHNENWALTKIEVKEITTIKYKNINEA